MLNQEPADTVDCGGADDDEKQAPTTSRTPSSPLRMIPTANVRWSKSPRLSQFTSYDTTRPAGGLILSRLSDAPGPVGPSEIREWLLVSGPTVTGPVDSLERQGLVGRTPHPDHRVATWSKSLREVAKWRASFDLLCTWPGGNGWNEP